MDEQEPVLIARIEIRRTLTPDGQDIIETTSEDSAGENLPLIEALGLIELAKDTVIREAMGEVDD